MTSKSKASMIRKNLPETTGWLFNSVSSQAGEQTSKSKDSSPSAPAGPIIARRETQKASLAGLIWRGSSPSMVQRLRS
ncbi:hypothetical protein VF10_21560 [Nostoc linckia z13]|nr:hypothetical protein VF10_21560 [Nostoc linckia z13]